MGAIKLQPTWAYKVRHSIFSGNFFIIFLNSVKKVNTFSMFFSSAASLYSVKQCCTADTTKFGSKAVAFRKLFTDSIKLSNIKWIWNERKHLDTCFDRTSNSEVRSFLLVPNDDKYQDCSRQWRLQLGSLLLFFLHRPHVDAVLLVWWEHSLEPE